MSELIHDPRVLIDIIFDDADEAWKFLPDVHRYAFEVNLPINVAARKGSIFFGLEIFVPIVISYALQNPDKVLDTALKVGEAILWIGNAVKKWKTGRVVRKSQEAAFNEALAILYRQVRPETVPGMQKAKPIEDGYEFIFSDRSQKHLIIIHHGCTYEYDGTHNEKRQNDSGDDKEERIRRISESVRRGSPPGLKVARPIRLKRRPSQISTEKGNPHSEKQDKDSSICGRYPPLFRGRYSQLSKIAAT